MTDPGPAWRRYLRFWGRDVDADVDDELRFHLDMRAEEKIHAGVDPGEARRLAMARFGDVDTVRSALTRIGRGRLRGERRRAAIVDLVQDLEYGVRILRRQRLPALVIVLCLALGIGATTTVFSLGDALLLRPLPFPNASRLVQVGTARLNDNTPGVSSFEDFSDWRDRQRSFAALGAIDREAYVVVTGQAVRVTGASVTSGVFTALGVRPLRGRLLLSADDSAGAPRVAVVSAGFAARMLSGVDRAVGRTVRLDDRVYDVVGVLDDGAAYPDGTEVWTAMARAPEPSQRNSRSLDLIGALREGGSLEEARNDLAAVSADLRRLYPDMSGNLSAVVRPLRERYVGAARPAFLVLAAAGLILLLIACANVASLQLARTAARTREMALRTALGAARGRLIRLLLTESVILAVVGGAVGVGIALLATDLVTRAIPMRLAAWMTPAVDLRVLAFTLLVSTLSGIAFGMLPALRLAEPAPARMLHGGARAGVDLRRTMLQRGLVAAEIALSTVLLIGAGLAVQSVLRLTRQNPGFDAQGVTTFRIAMQGPRYEAAEARVGLVRDLLERIALIPGVGQAGAASHLPIADCCSRFGLRVDGAADPEREIMVTGNVVTPGFFPAVGMELVRGRFLTQADREGAPEAMVINRTFEHELFGGVDAVGRVVHRGSTDAIVVGVVGDVKQTALSDAPEPQFYASHDQMAWDALTFAVRLERGDPGETIARIRRNLHELDPALPLYRVAAYPELLERAVASERVLGALLAGFAVAALVLATAGIYGVTSYYVAQRTSEMSIRIALGARPGRVAAMVVWQAGVLAGAGLAVGLAAGVLVGRALSRLFFGVSAMEPMVYGMAVVLLGGTAVVACLGPARRATAASPMAALNAE
jgi:predicted permease